MKLRHALALAFASASLPAHAANWFQMQNTEPPKAPVYKFFGFVQPTYTSISGDRVTGLVAPATKFNNHYALFNYVPPMNQSTSDFQFLRARLGVRGAINPQINYFLLGEAGKNSITTKNDVAATDAFLTFSYIPGVRIRVGQGRLPIGDEAMQPAFADSEYINFSAATLGLMNEIPTASYPAGTKTTSSAGLTFARTTGGAFAYRDLGVEAFDWFQHGKWEYAYALMASTGTGLYSLGSDYGRGDVSGRLQASYIFGGKGLNRNDVTGYVWYETGKRHFGGNDYTRKRYGVGARYHQGKLRVSGEYLWGEGMIFTGINPPFLPVAGPGPTPTYQIALADNNKAQGGYLEGGYYLLPKLEFDLRYDYYDRLTNDAANERVFKTWTLGAQYHFKPNLKLQFNYAIRTLDVPNPSKAGANAVAIANSMGNLAALQLTWVF